MDVLTQSLNFAKGYPTFIFHQVVSINIMEEVYIYILKNRRRNVGKSGMAKPSFNLEDNCHYM